MSPHLIAAQTGPINELEQRMLESIPAIERWFRLEWMEHTPPFYTSVDLRNAGFKLAPVNTNLFPHGFNKLTPAMMPLAVQAAMAAIEKICPEAKNLLLIPERNTDNVLYLANLARMVQIFGSAGLNVRLGTLDETATEPVELALPDGSSLTLEPLVRGKHRLGLKHFDPCTILINSNMVDGIPEVLQNLHEQYVLPPLHAGWALRRKSQHFASYEEVAKKFSKLLGMDSWVINPLYAVCNEVNFQEGTGRDCLESQVDALLNKIRKKYKEYSINAKPFVIIKTDNGSYGQHDSGMMNVHDVKDLPDFSPSRAKPAQGKLNQPLSPVIIQEGVPTYERLNNAVAEPVVYMIDRYVVGGFYRVHAERDVDENLNLPGASFVPLAFAEQSRLPKPGAKPEADPSNHFYMYGVIGRLAMLAASYELEATDPSAEMYA